MLLELSILFNLLSVFFLGLLNIKLKEEKASSKFWYYRYRTIGKLLLEARRRKEK